VTGLAGKNADFFLDLINTDTALFCLSETMYVHTSYTNRLLSDYEIHVIPAISHPRGRPTGGFLFGWKKELSTSVTILEKNQNSIFINFRHLSTNLLIIFYYFPPDGTFITKFRSMVEDVSRLGVAFPETILMGDSNAHVGTLNTVMGSERKSKDGRVDARGKELVMRAQEVDLQIGNGAMRGDLEGEATYLSAAGTHRRAGASVIDLLLFSSPSRYLIHSFQVLELGNPGHFPILTTLSLTMQSPPQQVSKYKLKIPKEEKGLAELSDEIETQIKNRIAQWDPIIPSVLEAAHKLNLIQNPRQFKARPRWFDAECCTLKYLKHKSLRQYRRLPNHKSVKKENLLKSYLEAKEKYQDVCKEKIAAFQKDLEDSLTNHRNPNTFWKAVKKIRTPRQRQPPPVDTEAWFKFYSEVFNPTNQPNVVTPKFNEMKPCEILDAPFTPLELKLTIKKLKLAKAPGPDLIPNEVWKLLTPNSLSSLCAAYQIIYDSGVVPPSWCQVQVSPIYKKGNMNDPANYRPISLLNTILKLFTTILTNRLNYWAETQNKLSEFQAGFRRGKSTLDQIFIITSLIQQHVNKGKKLFVCFVDLKQAFDTPNHNLLWKTLQQEGASGKLIRVLKSIYDQATAKIVAGGQATEEIKIAKGVLQGESASPFLFNTLMEGLSRKFAWLQILGPKIAGIPVHHLLFADDLALIATTPETLQDKISLTSNFFHSVHLNVNLGKTKVVVFSPSGRNPRQFKFKWRNDVIQVTNEYVYLGIKFTGNGRFHSQATNAISKGMGASAALQQILRKPRQFSLPVTQKLLSSILHSTTLYGAGIWGLTHAERLEATQQRYLKGALGLPRATAKYFVRIETGTPHTLYQVAKLAYLFWRRILGAQEGSLLRTAYESLRRGLEIDPDQKNNWCAQLRDVLLYVDLGWVWERNNLNTCKSYLNRFLDKLKERLTNEDRKKAKDSTTMPHYSSLAESTPAFYLAASLPRFAVTRIAQLRLNHSIVLNRRNWANVGAFRDSTCNLCGSQLSLSHLLTECPALLTRRIQFCQNVPMNQIILELTTRIQSEANYVSLHKFMTEILRPFEKFS